MPFYTSEEHAIYSELSRSIADGFGAHNITFNTAECSIKTVSDLHSGTMNGSFTVLPILTLAYKFMFVGRV